MAILPIDRQTSFSPPSLRGAWGVVGSVLSGPVGYGAIGCCSDDRWLFAGRIGVDRLLLSTPLARPLLLGFASLDEPTGVVGPVVDAVLGVEEARRRQCRVEQLRFAEP